MFTLGHFHCAHAMVTTINSNLSNTICNQQQLIAIPTHLCPNELTDRTDCQNSNRRLNAKKFMRWVHHGIISVIPVAWLLLPLPLPLLDELKLTHCELTDNPGGQPTIHMATNQPFAHSSELGAQLIAAHFQWIPFCFVNSVKDCAPVCLCGAHVQLCRRVCVQVPSRFTASWSCVLVALRSSGSHQRRTVIGSLFDLYSYLYGNRRRLFDFCLTLS